MVEPVQKGVQILAEGEFLRQGTPRDWPVLSRIVETSRWLYWAPGRGDPQELLCREPCVLWLRSGTIRGAALFTMHRAPVASALLLVLREGSERQRFFDVVFPLVEARMVEHGARWSSFTDPGDWLVRELTAKGYALKDQVLSYRKVGFDTSATGNPQVAVRHTTRRDVPSVLAVDRAAFEPFWCLNEPLIRQALDRSPYFLVALVDRQVVGYLMAEHGGKHGFISRIAVTPGWQGRGIGTRLMREAFVMMRRDGLREVLLNTQEENLRSRSFYERLEFRLTGECQDVWAKTLSTEAAPEL